VCDGLFQMTWEATWEYVDGVVLVVDREGCVLSAAKTCYAMYAMVERDKAVDVASPSGVIATARLFPDGAAGLREVGDFDRELAQQVLKFDVRDARAKDDEDKKKLLLLISQSKVLGGKDLNPDPNAAVLKNEPPIDCQAYEEFGRRVRNRAAAPALRAMAAAGENEEISVTIELCEGDGEGFMGLMGPTRMNLGKADLFGPLGEGLLHMAAATGAVENVELLLYLSADPNAPDSQGETPLHYAALGGQATIVDKLMMAHADVERKSVFSETPLQVARQNPAFFLGVHTEEVIQKLQTTSQERRSCSMAGVSQWFPSTANTICGLW